MGLIGLNHTKEKYFRNYKAQKNAIKYDYDYDLNVR